MQQKCKAGQLLASLVTVLLTLEIQSSSGYKILIWPAEFSHWYNLKIIAGKLSNHGHEVSVLRSSAYRDFMQNETTIQFVDFNVDGVFPGDHLKSMDQILHSTKLGRSKPYTITALLNLAKFSHRQMEMRLVQCRAILQNEDVLARLTRAKYNAMLADASVPCGEIIAAKLNLPLIYSVRTLPAELQYVLSETPMPLSYVPMINTGASDRMDFMERVNNVMQYFYQLTFMRLYMKMAMDPIVAKYYDDGVTYADLMRRAKAWLIRTDFAFEYPRPTMPNLHFVGGFHCREPNPLLSEVEVLANANPQGFIVFSMGSMVRSMHGSKAAKFAAAFAKLKYDVLWRYEGERPKNLGNNTHILNWLPQNDLLGHENCVLFITHGGTNGLYEAIYHGVPVLGFPLLVDQTDNMKRIEDRGVGLSLDIHEFEADNLISTVRTIVSDASFKENAVRLSKIHRDVPISPLNSAIFWIEHTIRNNGSDHLRPAAHELSFISFYMLDVAAYLLSMVILTIYLLMKMRRIMKGSETVEKYTFVAPRSRTLSPNGMKTIPISSNNNNHELAIRKGHDSHLDDKRPVQQIVTEANKPCN